jgi:hypothetical protein
MDTLRMVQIGIAIILLGFVGYSVFKPTASLTTTDNPTDSNSNSSSSSNPMVPLPSAAPYTAPSSSKPYITPPLTAAATSKFKPYLTDLVPMSIEDVKKIYGGDAARVVDCVRKYPGGPGPPGTASNLHKCVVSDPKYNCFQQGLEAPPLCWQCGEHHIECGWMSRLYEDLRKDKIIQGFY